MASIIWSGDIFAISFSLHRTGIRRKLEGFFLIVWFICNSSVLLFLQDGHRWTKSHVTTFSGMDPSYSLPDNVAIITIQVCFSSRSWSKKQTTSFLFGEMWGNQYLYIIDKRLMVLNSAILMESTYHAWIPGSPLWNILELHYWSHSLNSAGARRWKSSLSPGTFIWGSISFFLICS